MNNISDEYGCSVASKEIVSELVKDEEFKKAFRIGMKTIK